MSGTNMICHCVMDVPAEVHGIVVPNKNPKQVGAGILFLSISWQT
jgi:hypothetical protein